ncbi:MAG: hypothetical protein IK152_03295 [Lachnospiraceae bacterium]|nr:hypothetical protein [Lachnospiraceae bacterium]
MANLFREKSMERVSSPEKLNDYIKVTTPSVWLVLTIAVLLLVGALVWGVFGTVDLKNAQGNVESDHPISFIIN